MKTVSIIAATFYGNRGAEGMLSATIGKLREEYGDNQSFNVFSYYPKRDRELVSDSRVSIYSATPAYLVLGLLPCAFLHILFGWLKLSTLQQMLPPSVRALAGSKVLICLAGVSFVEGRTKFIAFNIATIWPAMLLGVPVVKFAQALGPFTTRLNRMTARIFLGRCRMIFARGETTYSHLDALLGESRNYQRADDVAFLFQTKFCISQPSAGFDLILSRLNDRRESGRTIVGVCPSVVVAKRAAAAGWNYRQRMCELIAVLVERGHTVALYPNATRGQDMNKSHNNDLPLLQDIYHRLDSGIREQVVGFFGSLNAEQIHRIINACDVQAVSRFHAMVASLASAIPVLVIGWSHKYLEVMERFAQQDMVLDYNNGSISPVVACLDRLIAERSGRSAAIAAALPGVQRLATRQIDYVIDILKCSS